MDAVPRTDRAPCLRIGQLAGQLGLNPKTMRYYEQVGLLPKPHRTAAGYRLYDAGDRDHLRFVLKAKAIGLTLAEIKEILALKRDGQQPCEHVLILLDRKLAAIEHRLRVLADFRDELAVLRQEAVETMGSDACVCGIIEHHNSIRPENQRSRQRITEGLGWHASRLRKKAEAFG